MSKIVLIHAAGDDAHARAVAQNLSELGVSARILDRERCFHEWSISCEDDDVVVSVGGERVTQTDVRAVYWRRDFIVEPEWLDLAGLTPPTARFIAEQRSIHVESAFKRLAMSCPFVNDITANRRSSSKVLQHCVARACGLRVPATYVGSDPMEAEAFVRRLWANGHRCCTKNIESTHVEIDGVKHARLTRLFMPDQLPELKGLAACPLIFQEYVEKRYEYRVTVVGDEVYACRIDSQAAGGPTAVDWRNYNIPVTPHLAVSLSHTLSSQLARLVRDLGLTYGAIDLIEDPEGNFSFLEVNCMGQWLWIEDLTELPISRAIARHLAKPVARPGP